MAHLTKLKFTTLERQVVRDPVMDRRAKLLRGIAEQKRVHAAVLEGGAPAQEGKPKGKPWFFEGGEGWHVVCRYGARMLTLGGEHNAVAVKTLADVAGVLDTFAAAAAAGELDAALARAAERKRQTVVPEKAQHV